MISLVRSGGIGVRGLSLIFVYVVTVAIAVSAFSALSFQNEIRGRSIDGQPVTVGRLTALISRLQTQEDRITRAREAMVNAEKALAEAEAKAFEATSQKRLLDAETERVHRALEAELSRLTGAPLEPLGIRERMPRFAAMLESIAADQRGAAKQLYDELAAKEDAFFAFEVKFAASQERVMDARQDVDEAREVLAGIEQEMVPLGAEIMDLRQQIEFFGSIPGGLFFASMPPSLLIPILVLAMGALGSVIRLTVEFIQAKQESLPLSWFLFTPLLGMITAFAVFILVQAGVLIITQAPSEGGGPGQLNPYVISFVGIVSGLVSDRAIGKLSEVAGNLFKTAAT